MDENSGINLDYGELHATLKQTCKLREPTKVEGRSLYRRVKVVNLHLKKKKLQSNASRKRKIIPLGHRKRMGMGKVLCPLFISLPENEIENHQEQRIENLCDDIKKINIKRTRSESSDSPVENQDCSPKKFNF